MLPRTIGVIGTVFAVGVLTACGSDSTGPGEFGSISATVADAGANPAPSAQTISRQTMGRGSGPAAVAAFSGTMTGSAQVLVYSDANGWVEVGPPRDVNCAMRSSDGATVASNASVAAGTYTRVRLILQGFHADLTAGSIVGALTLTSATSITLGGSDQRVEIDVDVTPFTISATGSARISFDLNSESWVTQQAAQSRSADDADVVASTTAHVVAQ